MKAGSQVDQIHDVDDAAPASDLDNALRLSWPQLYLGAIGFALSLYAFREHALAKGSREAWEKLGGCPFQSVGFDCHSVMGSKYGEFFGIPLGVFGMVYFVIVIMTGITTSPRTTGREAALWRLVVATMGFLGSIVLTYISTYIIKATCSICLGIHLINLLLFLVSVYGFVGARKAVKLTAISPGPGSNPDGVS
jgi:uncharacterized membrane protein